MIFCKFASCAVVKILPPVKLAFHVYAPFRIMAKILFSNQRNLLSFLQMWSSHSPLHHAYTNFSTVLFLYFFFTNHYTGVSHLTKISPMATTLYCTLLPYTSLFSPQNLIKTFLMSGKCDNEHNDVSVSFLTLIVTE